MTKDDLALFVSEKAAVIPKAARAMINAVFEGICSAWASKEARDYADNILGTLREPLAVLGADLPLCTG